MSQDEQAIRNSAKEFSQAFAKGDAKAIAAMWAEHGEYQDDSGKLIRGRDEIEKAYTELFKEKPGEKIDVEIQSVNFLTPDVAVEEGLLRESSAGRELPSTSRYAAIDVRDGGSWKIAQCREWGTGQDHLDDLNWLAGKWKGASKDQEMNLSFAWDEKLPILLAKISSTVKGKPGPSGTIKIGYDPRRGDIHSWHTDADGSQSRATWSRDGDRWIMNASGLTGDGLETSGQYILTRINNNNFTWRWVNRIVGDKAIPDTVPIRLTRVPDAK